MSMTQTVHYTVTGEQKIRCAGCEERIQNALRRLSGVQSVQASANIQQVVVSFDPTRVTADQVRAKLERLGYRLHTESDGRGAIGHAGAARPAAEGSSS